MSKNNPEDLDKIRHTLAHLLAASVLELYPGSENAIGPAVDDGFYQDFEIKGEVSDRDLQKIEQKMKEKLKQWQSFEARETDIDEVNKVFESNKYKRELAEEFLGEGKKITLHNSQDKNGQILFWDLCKGGHTENPSKDIDPKGFKLDRVAGAYWRGDENNKMLTRIYGLAFASKKELDEYLAMREEAKARDHRKLGQDLDLFLFSDLVGGGLPLWTPKGTLLRSLLDERIWKMREAAGYTKVEIPHITKKDLFETSGHWSKFSDELFKIVTREGHEFAMKPMNCPFHTQIYARKVMSYRELPQRYANTTMVYRDEQSGELSGLSRVRAITQDDAHVFARMSQAKQEILKIYDIVESFYGSFGFEMQVMLSVRDKETPEKYLGDDSKWQEAENILAEVAKEKKTETLDGTGEAAFYGPKLDFMAKDALGRQHQVATIQLDMNMPESFDLHCINEKGEQERIVMIHAAIMGSIERFMTVMLEHTAGNFPLWLSPMQVSVLPITDTQIKYAEGVVKELKEAGYRVSLDTSAESLGKKIRNAKLSKVPYILVLGEQEMKKKHVTVESRDEGKLGDMKLADFLKKLEEESK